jgi:DNA (cytosine-5)-methyltransferase 1
VGELLKDLMAEGDWTEERLQTWVERANGIAPTIVGGSKKHGGADLGPTRAKRAWAELGVDGLGIADAAPPAGAAPAMMPRLTCEMVTRLQGWRDEWDWRFAGLKTARYRQIGNAFPPPVAEAVGTAIRRALEHQGAPQAGEVTLPVHDPVFQVLRSTEDFLTAREIAELAGTVVSAAGVLGRLRHLGQDFELEVADSRGGPAYRLGRFKAFLGQHDHVRHQRFAASRATIS